MGHKIKLKRTGEDDIILTVDDAGVVSFNTGLGVIFHNIDDICNVIRTVIASMKSNRLTTIEVEEE